MFGYVKVYRPDLRIREYEAYRGVYCGICRQMGKSFGLRSRFVLGYDSVFVAMLAADVSGSPLCFSRCRCPVHPFEKRACAQSAEPLRFAGAVYLILLWYKLCDDLTDSRSVRAFFAKLWIRRAYRKAAALYPEADRIVRVYVGRQAEVENGPDRPLDAYTDPSAQAMGELCGLLSQDAANRRILSRLGYMLGRWVYLADAADDYEDDRRKGRFNALARSLPQDVRSSPDGLAAFVRRSLEMTRNELETAFSLLPEGMFAPILQNIIRQGLNAEAVRILAKPQKKGIHA